MQNGVNTPKHVLVMHARTYFMMMMSTPAFALIRMNQYWYDLVDSLAGGW